MHHRRDGGDDNEHHHTNRRKTETNLEEQLGVEDILTKVEPCEIEYRQRGIYATGQTTIDDINLFEWCDDVSCIEEVLISRVQAHAPKAEQHRRTDISSYGLLHLHAKKAEKKEAE